MIHPIVEKYARLLTQACLRVEPGDNVSLNLETTVQEAARPVVREVLRAGGVPHLRMHYPAWAEDLLELAPDAYFDMEPELELAEVKRMQAWLRIGGGANSRALQNADKARLSRLGKRNRPVQNHRVNHTKWCGTLFPTQAGAQDAGMSLSDYERFVFGAMFLYDDDPVAKWAELEGYQARIIERLREADEVRIVAEGTDLRLSVKGRGWINSAAGHNMPSGEVFTGPLEESADGVITYTVPSAVNGTLVEGVRLRFENGRVVEAHADKGDDLLQSQLNTDEGARFLGELGIGTNYNIRVPTKSILFDEKIGGTVHLALGQSYATTGGVNESAIHWDMICDLRRGGALFLDGELFQESGEFKL